MNEPPCHPVGACAVGTQCITHGVRPMNLPSPHTMSVCPSCGGHEPHHRVGCLHLIAQVQQQELERRAMTDELPKFEYLHHTDFLRYLENLTADQLASIGLRRIEQPPCPDPRMHRVPAPSPAASPEAKGKDDEHE